MKKLILLILLTTSLYAVGEAGATYLLISPGAEAAGMGEAMVAYLGTPIMSYYNPAALIFTNSGISVSRNKWLPNIFGNSHQTFLALNYKEFEEFCEMYSDIRLPFWMQTRPETISDYKIKKLADVGLHRISFGIEHGNEEFRRKVLDRRWKNDDIVDALKIPHRYGVQFSLNNITGFPDETRELIFDTIDLNSELTFGSNNCAFFQPFRGTELHTLSLKKGYIDESHLSDLDGEPILVNQPVSHDELRGLKRTFALYTRMGKEYWPQIKKAEQLNKDGDKAFAELQDKFRKKFFSEKLHWAN